ncbi:MAG: aspartate transaminase, partial [Comamonadaceae bacterium]
MNDKTQHAHPFLADRVLGAKPSATKEMTRLANQLKREGKSVIALSQGEPDFPTPAHVREAGRQAIDRNESRYT